MSDHVSDRARRRPWLAAALTLPLPGLGHVYAGRPRRGISVFAILLLAGLVNTLVFLMVPPSPWLVAFVMTISVGLLIGAAVDAALAARAAQRPYEVKRFNRWYGYAGVLVLGFAIGVVVERWRERFLEAYRNPSAAMAETLLVGDWFFVDKRASTRAALAHGAIVVYESPDDSQDKSIKRVVGLPGDTLAARSGALIRNGRVIKEPYAKHVGVRSVDSAWTAKLMGSWGPIHVPADSIFVLGDNRYASKDSRHVGFIPTRNVVGKPRLIYYSYDPKGDWPAFLTAIRWKRIGTMPQ